MAGGPLPLRQLQAEPVRQGSQHQAFLLVDCWPSGRQPDQSGLGSKILLKRSTLDHFFGHYSASVMLPLVSSSQVQPDQEEIRMAMLSI